MSHMSVINSLDYFKNIVVNNEFITLNQTFIESKNQLNTHKTYMYHWQLTYNSRMSLAMTVHCLTVETLNHRHPQLLKQVTQDAQLSQRDRAAGCVIVFTKSRTLELGDNDLRTL